MYNIRQGIFYLKDMITGNAVINNLKDISNFYENQNTAKCRSELDEREIKLLRFSAENVEYYRNNIKNNKELTLRSFPVIDKSIIRNNINDFIADNLNKSNLFKVVTSGSTGTPFAVYQNKLKKDRNTADAMFFGSLAGFSIGTQLNYLKIWTKVNKKNNFVAWAGNLIPIDVTQLSNEEIEKLVNKIEKSNVKKAFLGYASALESIVNYLEMNKPNFKFTNVTSVIAMSEAISDNGKKLIYKYFGVHCVSRYSNVENGIIAQQKNDGTSLFYVNVASYRLEILHIDKDEVVKDGMPGRIVVTDLFNTAMPMIRYDTGDIGILNRESKSGKVVLSNVEGRKMDMVFNTRGNLVSSFTITNNMWLYQEIKQYQFIQLSKSNYKFKLNLEGDFGREDELINEFKKHFGDDASITVEYVNEIPLLNSGKRKKVINEYYLSK